MKFLTIPNYIESLTGSRKVEAIRALRSSFLRKPNNFEECIEWALRLFEKEFYFKARDQLVAYPLDKKDEDGTLYWSGTQRPPVPQVFSANNQLHLDFIVALAHLRAYTMGLVASEFKPQDATEWKQRVDNIKAYVAKLPLSEYVEANLKVKTDGSIQIEDSSLPLPEDQLKILNALPKDTTNITWRPKSCDFEKDNDENFHIDCVHAWSNNRAAMYGIKVESRFRTKHIVGNIIPAIITATAFISGLACLEIYKQHQPGKKTR